MKTRVTRRQFSMAAGYALASVALGEACAAATQAADGADGRLTARPRERVSSSLESGQLGLSRGGRDGVIQLPSRMPEGKVPLLVYLHGASGNGAGQLRRIGPAARLIRCFPSTDAAASSCPA